MSIQLKFKLIYFIIIISCWQLNFSNFIVEKTTIVRIEYYFFFKYHIVECVHTIHVDINVTFNLKPVLIR